MKHIYIYHISGLPLDGDYDDDDDEDDEDDDGRTVLALTRSCVPPTSSSVHVQTGYQGWVATL